MRENASLYGINATSKLQLTGSKHWSAFFMRLSQYYYMANCSPIWTERLRHELLKSIHYDVVRQFATCSHLLN